MIGKPLGIVLTVWIAVRTCIADIAPEIGWLHLTGAGCLAGIGFTMSIFIATSAFEGEQLATVKLAILSGSVIAATLGMILLRRTNPPDRPAEAEASTISREADLGQSPRAVERPEV